MKKSKWDEPGVADRSEEFWNTEEIDAFRQQVADWIGPQTGSLLDLGCGTARMAPLLVGCSYVGLDGSKEMLRIAQTRVPANLLRLHDINGELPFYDNSFEAALCMEVFRHLPSYDFVLKELARVVEKRVYIVDAFQGHNEHHFDKTEFLGLVVPDNRWSLPLLLEDAAKYFPGWRIEPREFRNMAFVIKIEAP